MPRRTPIALVCVLALALLAGALGGCSGASKPSTSATSTTLQDSSQPLPSGTVPGLELVSYQRLALNVRASIDGWQAGGANPDEGPQLVKGSYRDIVTSAHLQRAETIVGSANGIAVRQVVLTFDPAGAAALKKATSRAVADQILVVLNGRVIDVQPMRGPIDTGTLQITAPSAAEAIEKAIAPQL